MTIFLAEDTRVVGPGKVANPLAPYGPAALPVDRALTGRAPQWLTVSLRLHQSVDDDSIAFAALFVCGRMLGLARAGAWRHAASGRRGYISADLAPHATLAALRESLHESAQADEHALDLAICAGGPAGLAHAGQLTLVHQDAGRWLSLHVDAGTVARSTARDVLQKIACVVGALTDRPDLAANALELVTDTARAILPDLSRPIRRDRFEPVADTLLRRAQSHPEALALVTAERAYCYAELARVVRHGAARLQAAGLQPGDIVAITGFMSFGMIAAMLATLAAGGVVAPIDCALPPARRDLLAQTLTPRFTAHIRPGIDPVDGLDFAEWPTHAVLAAMPEAAAAAFVPGDRAAAYVFFTSGSTGTPKAVLGTHQGLAHFLDWQRAQFPIGPGDRAAQITALSFDVVLRDVLFPLTSGATLHIPPRDMLLDAGRMLRWFADQAIGVMHCVPSLMRAWLYADEGMRPFSAIKFVFFAGEPLTDTLLARFRDAAGDHTTMVNLYGPTETTLAKLAHRVERIEPGVQPVGMPQPGVNVAIMRDRAHLCGLWETGESAIRTPYRALGYLGRDDLTAQAFLRNTRNDDPEDLLYFTGDLGRYRADGKVEIFGRMDAQIKIRGVRIEPGEIENRLIHLPQVRDAAVAARTLAGGDKVLIGFVVPDAPVAADAQRDFAAGLRDALRRQLSDAMVPSRIVVIDHLAYLPNGKLDRKALGTLEITAPATPRPDRPAPMSPAQAAIIDCVRRELPRASIDPGQSFVEIGGDSLSFVRVAIALEALLGPLPDTWQDIPLGALAQQVDRGAQVGATPRFPGFDTTLLVRAVAIVLVVITHLGMFVDARPTSALFVVSGMSFSRFTRPLIRARQNLQPVFRLVLKFGVPAGLWQAGLQIVQHRLWLPDVVLLGTFWHDPANESATFWYLDVLAANLALYGLITLAQARWLRGGSDNSGDVWFRRDLIVLAIGLLVAAIQIKSGIWNGLGPRGPAQFWDVAPFKWFWLLALGALIAQADSVWRRGWLFALIAATMLASLVEAWRLTDVFDDTGVLFAVCAGLLALTPRMPLPRWLHRPLGLVASSTLFIYLCNFMVIKRVPGGHWDGAWLVKLGAAIGLGIVLTHGWNRLPGLVHGRRPKAGTKGAIADPLCASLSGRNAQGSRLALRSRAPVQSLESQS